MSFKNKIKSYFTMDDEYEYVEENEASQQTETMSEPEKKNVVNLTSMKQASAKVVLSEPRSYSEAQDIADNIVNRRAVVINLQRVDHQQAKRIVDFLSGTVYAVDGNIQKLGTETFLCTPDNVDVSGTITDTFEDEHELNRGW